MVATVGSPEQWELVAVYLVLGYILQSKVIIIINGFSVHMLVDAYN